MSCLGIQTVSGVLELIDMKHLLTLRYAGIEDADMLLRWRNDPTTRLFSRNTNPVATSEHQRWLRQVVDGDGRKLFVAEEDGVPVGTARLDKISESELELSWTVAPGHRGCGIGKAIVIEAVSRVDQTLVAEIRKDNLASVKIAQAAGFRMIGESKGLLLFRREGKLREQD